MGDKTGQDASVTVATQRLPERVVLEDASLPLAEQVLAVLNVPAVIC